MASASIFTLVCYEMLVQSMPKFLSLYLVFSCLVGAMEIVDAVVLIKTNGALGTVTTVFAIVELFWVLVSCAAVVVSIIDKVNPLIPISFLVYNVSGWSLSLLFLVLGGGKFLPLNAAGQHVLPLWVYYLGMGFGIYFMLVNAIMLARRAKKPATSA